jgi:deoxycytidylate deaminase
MRDTNNKLSFYIGIVAPLGVDRDKFIKTLNEVAKNYKIDFSNKPVNKKSSKETICKISEIINFNDAKQNKAPESFKIFAKMQIFNKLRQSQYRENLAKSIIKMTKKTKNNLLKKEGDYSLIVINQIKNMFEYELLSYVYGKNYIQVGLFSSRDNRNNHLEKKFLTSEKTNNNKIELEKILIDTLDSTTIKLDESEKKLSFYEKNIPDFKLKQDIIDVYLREVRNDCSSYLLKKDFSETDENHQNSGQHVGKIYHHSHFYFNLDAQESDLKSEINKFLEIILGQHEEYPTQSELGMAIATQASVRSNFPHRRHVGAAILSSHGETISTGSIRAPSKSPNTTALDQEKINDGYDYFKKQTKKWCKLLKKIEKSSKNLDKKIDAYELRKFIDSTLDFHPCTHAEMSAILDAAKLGVSIRGASFYTTLYPCHLCAKDIISAGIKEVIYLEAYPKSKNEQLYPHNITDHNEPNSDKIIFSPFFGVGPERFHFYYSLKNKSEKNRLDQEKWKLHYENNAFISKKENEVINFKKNPKSPLSSLIQPPEKKHDTD